MIIYIASSWKNVHAVEMLTEHLRKAGHSILSFVENNHGENPNSVLNEKYGGKALPFVTLIIVGATLTLLLLVFALVDVCFDDDDKE